MHLTPQFNMSALAGDPFWGVTAMHLLTEIFGVKEKYSVGDLLIAKGYANFRATTHEDGHRSNLTRVEQILDIWTTDEM